MKRNVAICSYVDICLKYGVSIIQRNDRISEFLSACTTKLKQIFKLNLCCVQHILSSLYMYLINFLTFNFKIFLIFTYLKDFIQKYKLQKSFYIDHFVREKTRFSNYTNLIIKWALTKGIGNAI